MNVLHCNIGTIGHVDHGKTTLTAALAKVLALLYSLTKELSVADIDRTPEERERKITIVATHINYNSKNRDYAHIDCPGHQHYVKNMITGASVMDGAILVISLGDGPQEQTREHILLAKQIGIQSLFLFVNKIDSNVLNVETLELIELELIEMLSEYGYFEQMIPIVFGSARLILSLANLVKSHVIGLNSFRILLDVIDYFISQPKRDLKLPFLMPIESVYSILGRGTVVSGCIEKGLLEVGTEVEVLGLSMKKNTTCIGLESFHRSIEKGFAGDNVGILLRGFKKDEVKRGQVVVKTHSYGMFSKVKALILLNADIKKKKPFYSGYKPQLFIRTLDITGTIHLPSDVSYISPGETSEVSIFLIDSVCLEKGLSFTMREGRITIGYGRILELIK